MAASYYFYACWDFRFLFLLIFSTLLDYYTGIKVTEAITKAQKNFWFWLSVSVNLGFLGVFKYYNFFANSFAELLSNFGVNAHLTTLQIILPVGISFYTFHGLSYVIDIYKDRIKPERNFVNYSLFVSYFPLLVAGPIERATHLLPQLQKPRIFDYNKSVDGLRQMLWGFFKKVVIADNCAEYANQIFNHSDQHNGWTLFLGALLFTIQIYGDFSGYSDIALGCSRLFGIELLRNFAYPYFSRDIAEFWRRWHISLSSWFKDYLYIPLGGSKGGLLMKIRNTFIIFLVSGFWHGANWTFIAWGAINAFYFLPSLLFNTNRNNIEIVAKGRLFPTLSELFNMSVTFILAVLAWIFFRANDLHHAIQYLGDMFANILNVNSLVEAVTFVTKTIGFALPLFTVLFFVVEWIGREENHPLAKFAISWPKLLRLFLYYCIVMVIFLFAGKEQQFIYFQF